MKTPPSVCVILVPPVFCYIYCLVYPFPALTECKWLVGWIWLADLKDFKYNFTPIPDLTGTARNQGMLSIPGLCLFQQTEISNLEDRWMSDGN